MTFGNDYTEGTEESGRPQRTCKKRNQKRKPKLIDAKAKKEMMPGKIINGGQNILPVTLDGNDGCVEPEGPITWHSEKTAIITTPLLSRNKGELCSAMNTDAISTILDDDLPKSFPKEQADHSIFVKKFLREGSLFLAENKSIKQATQSQEEYIKFLRELQRQLWPLSAAVESQMRGDKARVEYLLFLDKFVATVKRKELISKAKLLVNKLTFDAEFVHWQRHQAADETITRLRPFVENHNVEELLSGRMPGEPPLTEDIKALRTVAPKLVIENELVCYIFTGQNETLAVPVAPKIMVPTLCQQIHVALGHATCICPNADTLGQIHFPCSETFFLFLI